MRAKVPVELNHQVIAARFVVDGVLGSGGMGTVYRAHDLQSGATVALKAMHAPSGPLFEADTAQGNALFLEELIRAVAEEGARMMGHRMAEEYMERLL